MTGPLVSVALERQLLEQVCPGTIADTEEIEEGFPDLWDRAMWIADRVGRHIEEPLREAGGEP